MKAAKLILGLVPFICAGCLGPQPSSPTYWPFSAQKMSPISSVHKGDAVLGLNRIRVSEPYDSTRFCVLRADGSLAFDDLNAFAACPSRGLMPLFEYIVQKYNFARQTTTDFNPSSSIPQLTLELRRFAVDCREKGKRKVICDLKGTYKGADGKLLICRDDAIVFLEDSDYGAAFSRAFTCALEQVLRQMADRLPSPTESH